MASKLKQAAEQPAPSVEAIRVQTIVETLGAAHQQGVQFEPQSTDELRWMAEDLKVPFLVVWLADNRQMDMLTDPDVDDIVRGLDWLRTHNVPLELLRHAEQPRDAKWRESIEAEDAKELVEKRIHDAAISHMDKAARAAKATGLDVSKWMKARLSMGEFHD